MEIFSFILSLPLSFLGIVICYLGIRYSFLFYKLSEHLLNKEKILYVIIFDMRNLSKIQDKINRLKTFCEKNPNILALFIFGSFGTEEELFQSDIDFAILYYKNIPLIEHLNVAVEFVKILEREDVDVLNLNEAPIDIKMRVISEGELIYCSNEIKLSDFKEKVFDLYADYEPVLRKFYEDYIEGIKYERNR